MESCLNGKGMQDLPKQSAAADLESLEHSAILSEYPPAPDRKQQTDGEDDDLIFDIAELGLFASNANDSDEDSNFSLDYEYIGPRQPKYADSDDDCELVASDMSNMDSDMNLLDRSTYFDMWDEDIYSTNDYTWESNDMRLSLFVKQRNHYLRQRDLDSPWQGSSFWRRDRGWPMQLPNSCSTTNHDQSANTLCAVKSNMAVSEHLVAFYKDRIVKCGEPTIQPHAGTSALGQSSRASHNDPNSSQYQPEIRNMGSESCCAAPQLDDKPGSIFLRTHASIALPTSEKTSYDRQSAVEAPTTSSILDRCKPYTKHLKRSQFVPPSRDDAYISLGFEPLCLDHNYGYMAVGGLEGELLVYCNVDPVNPVKIWGTKFKRKNNVMLMTNAVQIVRWRTDNGTYKHMLVACMNEAGVLVYNLPPHHECAKMARNFSRRCTRSANQGLSFHSHLRDFQQSPINDARVSPDGNHMVFVGDDSRLFIRDVIRSDDGAESSNISFGPTQVLTIPPDLLTQYSARSSTIHDTTTNSHYSSQHVAWSNDSTLFAHTSDSHYCVLVWSVESKEILLSVDAAGFTYAITFHPSMRSILAFSNRYGYFHTVDLNQTIRVNQHQESIGSEDNFLSSIESNSHSTKSALERSSTIIPRQEITMVSFRGEKNTKLRILAKINGLCWSGCGQYLYVATKKRVLVYEFMSRGVRSLVELASDQARKILELDPLGWKARQCLTEPSQSDGRLTRKRKRLLDETFDYEPWYRQWKRIPDHLQYTVLGDNVGLASHD
ncbi:unnamed protein product [Umbelopsis ramanniana]